MSKHPHLQLAICLGALAAGCASTDASKKSGEEGPKPIAQLVEATNQPSSIGKFLADLDTQIRGWNNLYLSALTAEDKRKTRMLEDNLSALTHKRRAEIMEQLATGPLNNRVIAASALGFTRDREALSPLIAALDDPHEEVVGNALVGLLLLGQADTPLEPICRLMQTSRDDGVRRNAATCLAVLIGAGARADCVLPAARLGLVDPEPGVRSQCCLVLAALVDTASLTALCDKLYDVVPLVAAAAARAVSHIGAESPTDKGTCARALAKAHSETKGTMQVQMRRALVELAGSDHGPKPEEWVAWATRLP